MFSPATSPAVRAGGQPGAGNVASYKFDETGGAAAVDSSGHGRNAAIISGAGVAAHDGRLRRHPGPGGSRLGDSRR